MVSSDLSLDLIKSTIILQLAIHSVNVFHAGSAGKIDGLIDGKVLYQSFEEIHKGKVSVEAAPIKLQYQSNSNKLHKQHECEKIQ